MRTKASAPDNSFMDVSKGTGGRPAPYRQARRRTTLTKRSLRRAGPHPPAKRVGGGVLSARLACVYSAGTLMAAGAAARRDEGRPKAVTSTEIIAKPASA